MQWGSFLSECDQFGNTSIISSYATVTAMSSVFDTFARTVFSPAMVESVLCRMNVAIGAINEPYVKSFFQSLLTASFVSKNFAFRFPVSPQ